MMSLLDLISQKQPLLKTHQAILIIGLQNDFIAPEGRFPVDLSTGFLTRLKSVVPKFRELSANVVWIQTFYEADRANIDPATGMGDAVVAEGLVDDSVKSSSEDDDDFPKDHMPPTPSRSARHKQRAMDMFKRVSARRKHVPVEVLQSVAEEDDDLFLARSFKTGPVCVPNSTGAEFTDFIKPCIQPQDAIVPTTNYSAFSGSQLLLTLRARLVTEVFVCGCITNVSILATVVDAARHGIKINVIADCLGFRKSSRHDQALKRMVELFDANVVTSAEILGRTSLEQLPPQIDYDDDSKDVNDELEHLVGKLRLTEPTNSQAGSRRSSSQSPAITLHGRHRNLSGTSAADSRAPTESKLSDEQFVEKLAKGAKVSNDSRNDPAPKQILVKRKIQMRSRPEKKKESDKKNKESAKQSQPSDSQAAETSTTQPSPKAKEPEETPKSRTPRIPKAESSDRLGESPVKWGQALKSSASQPSLSSTPGDAKESKPSRMRLALSRSSKSSETTKVPSPPAQPSPTQSATATPAPSSPRKPPPKPTSVPTTPTPVKSPPKVKKVQSLATLPVMRPGDRIAEGDSRIIYDFFPPGFCHPTEPIKPLQDTIFEQLCNEVQWQIMHHQQGEVPRLVCCQGEFGGDGSMPVYRHPTDQVLPLLHFSSRVQLVRRQAEKLVGHPLNHVLIQLYRSGQDYISEHSDKSLDIMKGSHIVNISFGAQRTMRLRTKKSAQAEESEEGGSRSTQRVALPHNSMFVLGLSSNRKWLHGINADKRLDSERSEDEKAYSGMRISLTFRHIGTFLDAKNELIWGQGATCEEQRNAQDVINDDEDENEKVVRAFSSENHNADFDWDKWYGDGFDVLHFRDAPEDVPILFASGNDVEDKIVRAFLAETKLQHVCLEPPAMNCDYAQSRRVCYRDNDVNHTEVYSAVPILLYLDRYHPVDRDDRGRACSARAYELFVSVSALLKMYSQRNALPLSGCFNIMLNNLEESQAAAAGPFAAGRRFSIGDCALWPVLDEIITSWEEWSEDQFPVLTEYYRMLWKKKRAFKELRSELPRIQERRKGKGDTS